MARQPRKNSKKGFFSDVRLPVAKRYVYPQSRTSMLLIGGGGALLILVIFIFNLVAQRGTLISNGPLSSNHAVFGDQCSTCHTSFANVANAQCATCHEKSGDSLGVHTFASHYLYRSGDLSRAVASGDEPACFSCHNEHVGRDASITDVSDVNCNRCHEYGSFNDEHPEFSFVRQQEPDPANLKFPHTLHVTEVKSFEELGDVEETCLYCHNPEPSGATFQPLDFGLHCAACHLSTGDATGQLPIASPGDLSTPGVLTIQAIRAQQPPGTNWTASVSPSDFQEQGGQIRKRPIYHNDPWILYNLRRIRSAMYPSNGLADLLETAIYAPAYEATERLDQALGALRAYTTRLRSRQDAQAEVREADRLMTALAHRRRDPNAPIDVSQFIVETARTNPALTTAQMQGYERVVNQLIRPCQQCHFVEKATFKQTQPDQRILRRSEFDHRAHVIEQRCLDCHNTIPIAELIASGGDNPEVDNAQIQNIPPIAQCLQCHTDKKASNTCVTCHLFHPDQSQHANLLLFLKE